MDNQMSDQNAPKLAVILSLPLKGCTHLKAEFVMNLDLATCQQSRLLRSGKRFSLAVEVLDIVLQLMYKHILCMEILSRPSW